MARDGDDMHGVKDRVLDVCVVWNADLGVFVEGLGCFLSKPSRGGYTSEDKVVVHVVGEFACVQCFAVGMFARQ
jgi:hypothetical protein